MSNSSPSYEEPPPPELSKQSHLHVLSYLELPKLVNIAVLCADNQSIENNFAYNMIKNLLGEQFNNHKFIFYYIGVGIDSSKLTKHNCDISNIFHNYNLNSQRIELSKIYKDFFNIIIEENCPINLSENSQHGQISVLFNNFNEIIEQCLNKINGYLIMSQSKYQSIKKIHFNFLTKFKEVRIITPKNKIYKWSVYKLENFEPTSGGKSKKSKKLRNKKSKKLRNKKSKKSKNIKKSKKVKKYQKNYNL